MRKSGKNDLMNEKDSKERMKYEKQMKQENIYNGQDILKPKNDVVFQALFTRGSEYVTKTMIEDIIKIDIHKIDLDKSKDLLNDNARNKNGRLDIRAILNGNIDCDVEMQLVPHEKMIERFLYYWAKMYTANLKEGENYRELKKSISIIVLDAEIPLLKRIPKSYTKWEIREAEYQKEVLTDHFEMHIISLPEAIKEYDKNKDDKVLQWMMFLNDPGSVEVAEIMKKNKAIKEANKKLYEISQDEALRRQALNEEIARMDEEQRMYDAIHKGLKEGREEGKAEGIKQGRAEGKAEGKAEMIKQLASIKMDVKQIAMVANMTEEEVRQIVNEKNK
jgi:predicted transposase/invertase (TIGR01784 family)